MPVRVATAPRKSEPNSSMIRNSVQGNCKNAASAQLPAGSQSRLTWGQCVIRTAPSASLFEWTQASLATEAVWIDKFFLLGSPDSTVPHRLENATLRRAIRNLVCVVQFF